MDRIEIKKTLVIVAIKFIILQLISSLLFLTASLISDSVDQFNNGTFMNLITYDSFTFVIIVVVQLAFTIYILLEWAMEKYVLLPDKILHQWGIIFRETDSWEISNIETGYIDEGLVARLFGYGTITFHSPTLESRVILRDVPSPYLILSAVQKSLSVLGKTPVRYMKSRN